MLQKAKQTQPQKMVISHLTLNQEELESIGSITGLLQIVIIGHIIYHLTVLTGEWTELPIIQPHHIVTSRRIKYIFTGNLEADVISNPFFFGKEKHLLKA
jgi:hypothetical protein